MRHSTPLAQFFDRVDFDGANGCWIWTGPLNEKGYGIFWWKRKSHLAHRWLYKELIGPVPESTPDLDHLCRVRNCVNIYDHLEPVTHQENMRRGRSYWRERDACSAGHTYTAESTYWHGGNYRACRICKNESQRRQRAKR